MSQEHHPPARQESLAFEEAGHEPPDAAQRHQQQFLALLRRRWHWALALGLLLGGPLAWVGYDSVTPAYRAVGRVSVDPAHQPGSLAETEIRFYDRFLHDQAERMRGQEVIEAALRHEEWRALGRGANITIEDVREFREELEVSRQREGQSLVLTYTDRDPEAARAGVIAVIDAYQRIYSQRISQTDAHRMRILEQRRDRLESQIEQLERDRDRLLRAAGHGDVTERRQHRQNQLWDLETAIDQTRRQIELIESGEADETDLAALSVEQIAQQDAQMRNMLEQQRQYQEQIQYYIEMGLGQNHRDMRRARTQLDALNRRIEGHARQYREHGAAAGPIAGGYADQELLGSPEELRARLNDLQETYARLERELETLDRFDRELRQNAAELDRRRNQLRAQQNQIEELELRPSDAQRIMTTDQPMLPTEPYNSGARKQRAAFGALGGGGLGAGLVLMLGLLDRRFRRVGDAELTLPAARILGVLPALPHKKVKPDQAATAAHCIHHIRTMLQISDGNVAANGADHHGRVITVTSPSADAGKTSLVTALGVSFAASGERTLMIDCDVIGGGLSQRLGVAARRPLEDVLRRYEMLGEEELLAAKRAAQASGKPLDQTLMVSGRLDSTELGRALRMQSESTLGIFDVCDGEPFDACVAETSVENLFLLPLGNALPEQAGNLSPEAVQRVLAKARGRFDTVLIDTGPLLGSLEASMTVVEADDTVLILSRGDEKAAVSRSIDVLHTLGASFAGIVFNRATDTDIEHSSYASTMPKDSPMRTSLRYVDPETSDRFGPMGAAVTCYSPGYGHVWRRQRNGKDDEVAVEVDGEDRPDVMVLDEGQNPAERRRKRHGRREDQKE